MAHIEGHEEWSAGRRGWKYGASLSWSPNGIQNQHAALAYRRVAVLALNALQLKLDSVDIPALFPGDGHVLREKVWTKNPKETDVAASVLGVQHLLEVLLYHERDPTAEPRGAALLQGADRDRRWAIISKHAKKLMRHSEFAPDAPVQWAGHSSRHDDKRTVVNMTTLTEVVERLSIIIEKLIVGFPNSCPESEQPSYSCAKVKRALDAGFVALPSLKPQTKGSKCDNPANVFISAIIRPMSS